MKTIAFIGGGRITRIFLRAFQNKSIAFNRIYVYDINQENLNKLKVEFSGIEISHDNLHECANNDVLFIALHPPVLMDTLSALKGKIKSNTLVVSLAPKITMEKMSIALNGHKNLARMNPSASTVINKGVNPISFNKECSTKQKHDFMNIFGQLGYTPEVDESKIEAYAVISAMGHTYFFFQLDKLKELATSFGMDEKEAQTAIAGMITGTTDTLFNSGLPYNEVSDLVPVKPLAGVEGIIKGYYDQYLTEIFNKIKPQ
jgi:pyrroline-5-carboxylate reductase